MCLNCHEDFKIDVTPTNRQWQRHVSSARAPRNVMDQTEQLENGHIAGFVESSPGAGDWHPDTTEALAGVCVACHRTDGVINNDPYDGLVNCDNLRWKQHLVNGESNRDVWAKVSEDLAGSTCGW